MVRLHTVHPGPLIQNPNKNIKVVHKGKKLKTIDLIIEFISDGSADPNPKNQYGKATHRQK
jgi:hypothetical protein